MHHQAHCGPVLAPGHGDRGFAQIFINQGVVAEGAAGDHLDAVGETVVALHDGDDLLHAGVFLIQVGHGVLSGLDPQGQVGAAVPVYGFGVAQQPFQVPAANHGFYGPAGRGVFVHGQALLQTLIRSKVVQEPEGRLILW